MISYVFKLAVAIAFLCENTVEAIQIQFISIHLPLDLLSRDHLGHVNYIFRYFEACQKFSQ